MSRELANLLQARARIDVLAWPAGIALTVGLHLLVVLAIVLGQRIQVTSEAPTKVTWVTLPAASGVSGGAGALEEGTEGERLRRTEDVAPKAQESGKATPTPDGLSAASKRAPVQGTNPDPNAMGQAKAASKSAQPVANPQRGAAGSGGGQGIGEGTGVPGLKTSGGAQGGVGMIGELDGNFPFAWYLQQVQNRVTSNWYRPGGVQGRVQIYFRIRKDGRLESIRRETPSPNPTLNDSAEQAVRRSSPMPPLPEGFEGSYLGVWFWFNSN